MYKDNEKKTWRLMENNITFICDIRMQKLKIQILKETSFELGKHNSTSLKGYGNPFIRLSINRKVS